MTVLDLFSEPFARTGNIAAEGFRNLLGRPALGIMQTVIRESIQNSIDAAKNGCGPEVLLRVRLLDSAQRKVLAERVFSSLPSCDESRTALLSSLSKSDLRVLEVCDFHTTGLEGPTRADIPPDTQESLDFVNFLRNIGVVRDTYHGGGTYGYGKTSLYSMSACSTILVDSETTISGDPVRRFMGCHLGSAFDSGVQGSERRYTGRHWWGVLDGEGGVDPAEENSAETLSTLLGMPDRMRGLTGTSVMIIDPCLPSDDISDVQNELVETVLWNFWPRLTASTPSHRKVSIHIEIDGDRVEIPAPENFPPLDLYSAAMKAHRVNDPSLQKIKSQRPSAELGHLAISRGIRAERHYVARRDGSCIPSQSSHIALMRPVELVVKYVEGEPYPDHRFEWAGVFICSDKDNVESAFAASEPPVHDDWIPGNLPKGSGKTFVNVALKRLKEIAQMYTTPDVKHVTGAEQGPSLAKTAALMGNILDKASGQESAPRKQRTTSSGRSASRRTSVTQPHFIRLERDRGGSPKAIFHAFLNNDGSVPDLLLIAEPYLVIDGGVSGTDDLPLGYAAHVINMNILDTDISSDNGILSVGENDGDVEVSVQLPSAAAVGLRLRLSDEEIG